MNKEKKPLKLEEVPAAVVFEAEKVFVLELCNLVMPNLCSGDKELIEEALDAVCEKDEAKNGYIDPDLYCSRRHIQAAIEELENADSLLPNTPFNALKLLLETDDNDLTMGREIMDSKIDAMFEDYEEECQYVKAQGTPPMSSECLYRADPQLDSIARRVMDVLTYYGGSFTKEDLPRLLNVTNRYYELCGVFSELELFLVEWDEAHPADSLTDNTAAALGAFMGTMVNRRKSWLRPDAKLVETIVKELLEAHFRIGQDSLEKLLPSVRYFSEASFEDYNEDELTLDEFCQVLDHLCEMGYIQSIWRERDTMDHSFVFVSFTESKRRLYEDCQPGKVLDSKKPGLVMPAPFERDRESSTVAFMGSVNPRLYRNKESWDAIKEMVEDVQSELSEKDEVVLCAVGGFGLPTDPELEELATTNYPDMACVNGMFFTDNGIRMVSSFEKANMNIYAVAERIKEVSITVCSGYECDVTNRLHEPYAKLEVALDSFGTDFDRPAIFSAFSERCEVYLPRHTDEQLLQLAGYIQFALREMGANIDEIIFRDEDDQ